MTPTASPSEAPPAVDDTLEARRAVGPSAGEAAAKEEAMMFRCVYAAKGRLTYGRIYEATVVENDGDECLELVDDSGELTGWISCRFDEVASAHPGWEPDKDLLNLAFPCPPVDKYAEHRRKLEADGITENSVALETCAKQPMGTANLHAGLESEKVRERVKAFPKQGRNFGLSGGGDE